MIIKMTDVFKCVYIIKYKIKSVIGLMKTRMMFWLVCHRHENGILDTILRKISKTYSLHTEWVHNEKLKEIFNKCIHQNRTWEKEERKSNDNVIYFMWLQGLDNAPPIVKACYHQLEKAAGDKRIIVLDESNIFEYVALPEYIVDKWRKGIISNTHFSDIVRIELLINWGGYWIDSTALLTNSKVFQKCEKVQLAFSSMGGLIQVNDWFLYAKTNDNILSLIRECLLVYWQENNHLENYFIMQIFGYYALRYYSREYKSIFVLSHELAHYLIVNKMFSAFNQNETEVIAKYYMIHKLTYKIDEEKIREKGTLYRHILDSDV